MSNELELTEGEEALKSDLFRWLNNVLLGNRALVSITVAEARLVQRIIVAHTDARRQLAEARATIEQWERDASTLARAVAWLSDIDAPEPGEPGYEVCELVARVLRSPRIAEAQERERKAGEAAGRAAERRDVVEWIRGVHRDDTRERIAQGIEDECHVGAGEESGR